MMTRYHLVTGAAALAILLGQSSQVFGHAAYNAWGNCNADESQNGDAMHYEAGHHFDTGTLTLEFQAIAGTPLDIAAFIYTHVTPTRTRRPGPISLRHGQPAGNGRPARQPAG